MDEFKDTNGLIIDLRQYTSDFLVYGLPSYFANSGTAFAITASASTGSEAS